MCLTHCWGLYRVPRTPHPARSIKRHDRLAVSKVVTQFMRSPPRSPLATCVLIRYARSLLAADPSAVNATALGEFLESCE
jgi:coatomer subunit gamma